MVKKNLTSPLLSPVSLFFFRENKVLGTELVLDKTKILFSFT